MVLQRTILLPFLLLLLSCPQRLDLSQYADEERQIFLFHFRNSTFQPQIHLELTEQVRREIDRRSNFILTSNKKEARFWLNGEINLYYKKRGFRTAFSEAAYYEIIAACRIKLLRNPRSAVLQNSAQKSSKKESPPIFLREISHRVHYSEQKYISDNENRARQRLFRILAVRINQAIESQF